MGHGVTLDLGFPFPMPKSQREGLAGKGPAVSSILVSLGHMAASTVPETKYMLWNGVQGSDCHLLEFHSFPGCGQQRAL